MTNIISKWKTNTGKKNRFDVYADFLQTYQYYLGHTDVLITKNETISNSW